MDKQDTRAVLKKITSRFSRSLLQPQNIYGRRTVPAAGFSLAELKEAGISLEQAKEVGIAVDEERMNALGANIESLRSFMRE
jgi:ribosomal protein L13E